ncbi:non-canonical purine NTP pyrophosphatase, RdgB/HAM1 family [Porphyromonas sp. oral taxon 278 str. W7784]|jgi:non-canonical purine NTP pyrophosphatase, rdgB/HAM1 family|uniref:non-canonical purine NTP diphosphatase n=1 Tax=Porphyromonas sp. oral taxon 278 TaxID=712437 RepID=UPI0003AD6EB2|nr:non-canonical purine NTP diphosphatase [Porphyromonas sp. oral taxon 278]ERJ70252.1 non-canonical purine NTP pyrophosphatase, RdgB/HAM1 family [Porphyromonas sp. oral taxon 278 str. W7784]
MKKLVFASNNAHKLSEIRAILGDRIEIISLSDLQCHDEIPETADTLEGNALIKARYVWEHYGLYCFADDTGLEVEALGGAPGVYSARFAGEHASFEDNVSLLLERLSGVAAPRRARFRTVIALIDEYGTHFFEGSVDGEITLERSGDHGFGYDPIFRPEGREETFAQLTEQEKNSMSHRGRAVQKLVRYLQALP